MEEILKFVDCPIYVNKNDVPYMDMSHDNIKSVDNGHQLSIGDIKLTLIHTPGHTPGSQCFLVETAGEPGRLVSGDTLFLNACGRVDLPGGDPEALFRSLHGVLKQLPDETVLYPGHLYAAEPFAGLGEQKRTNPYLRAANAQQFLSLLGYRRARQQAPKPRFPVVFRLADGLPPRGASVSVRALRLLSRFVPLVFSEAPGP